MKGGFLGFKDDDAFWGRPLAHQAKVIDRLLDRKPCLLLDAPSQAELPLRQGLPVVVALVATYEQLHGLDPGRAGALVAVNVDTTDVWAGTLEDLDGVEPTDDAGPPPATKGTGALLLLADARQRTTMGWTAGASYLLSALMRERGSNRVPVRLVPGPGVYVDPAVQALVRARRRAHALRPSSTGPLAGGGLDLDDAAARALVPGAPAQKGDPELDARVSAVVPVALVVTGAIDAAPRVLTLRAPVLFDPEATPAEDGPGPDDDGPEVAVSFAVDLRQVPGFPRDPGTYFVSAFSGAHAAGPAPVALVSPLSLKGA